MPQHWKDIYRTRVCSAHDAVPKEGRSKCGIFDWTYTP